MGLLWLCRLYACAALLQVVSGPSPGYPVPLAGIYPSQHLIDGKKVERTFATH
ncbi:hypothetical protein PGT21_030354 [Puccinia graminis f. sp. tritici]|uniref:Uncharacterized protein n=1 Tax=Puccinia graminis f. sp. tritici TaxID=56615 RepID=A0A5B0QY21_PUCGR|nr:hypothetical protein PGT21_030354 [Puccinia graminis f. sp. tritici]